MFGYKARVNLMFLNISRWLEIIERERNELLLSVKNSQELVSNAFPYIAPIIPRLLPGEVIGGEHFVLVDLLKSISGSSFQGGRLESLKPRALKGPQLASSSPISHL